MFRLNRVNTPFFLNLAGSSETTFRNILPQNSGKNKQKKKIVRTSHSNIFELDTEWRQDEDYTWSTAVWECAISLLYCSSQLLSSEIRYPSGPLPPWYTTLSSLTM